MPPTKASRHFDRGSHSPSVFADGYGVEVDLWSVGELISQCKALDIWPEVAKARGVDAGRSGTVSTRGICLLE